MFFSFFGFSIFLKPKPKQLQKPKKTETPILFHRIYLPAKYVFFSFFRFFFFEFFSVFPVFLGFEKERGAKRYESRLKEGESNPLRKNLIKRKSLIKKVEYLYING